MEAQDRIYQLVEGAGDCRRRRLIRVTPSIRGADAVVVAFPCDRSRARLI
jgi:hypothetical protein